MNETRIRKLIDDRSLRIEFLPVEQNPFMPNPADGLRHFFCTLEGQGIEGFEFYYSCEDDGAKPQAEAALARLIDDIEDYSRCAGFEAFAALLGEEGEGGDSRIALAYEEIARLASCMERLIETEQSPSVAPGA